MIHVSGEFRNELANGNHNFATDITITLSDNTVLELDNTNLTAFSAEDSVSDDNALTALGAAIINQLELTIANVNDEYSEYDFTDAKIDAKLGLITQQYNYTDYSTTETDELVIFNSPFTAPIKSLLVSLPTITGGHSEIVLDSSDLNTITLPGTVYGGTFDIISGVLTVTISNTSDPDALPIGTYQLEPQSVWAYVGDNVVWSSTGNITVQYYTAREDAGTSVEDFRYGTYTVDETVYGGGTITLTALDNMSKLDRPYHSSLVWPVSIQRVINEICSACDVVLETQTYPHSSFLVSEPPVEECTYREVLSWAAQIAGCFAKFNKRGQLELNWFDTDTLALYQDADETSTPEQLGLYPIATAYSQELSVDDVVITAVRIVVQTEEEILTFTEGTDGYTIEISGNGFITEDNAEDIVEWLGQQLIGVTYRQAKISCGADPTMEAGDVGFTFDRWGKRYPILITRSAFKIGSKQSIISAAETPSRNSSTRFTETVKNYVEARKLVEKEKSDRQIAEDALAQAIASSGGLYSTHITEPSGGTTYYLHNKPTLAQSDVQMRVTDEAVGVSADGGETWYGLTVDGQLVVNAISTIGLSADYIYTGTLDASRISMTNLYAENIKYDEDNTLVDALQNLDDNLTDKITQTETGLSSAVDATRQLINDLNSDVNPLLQSMTITPQDGLKMSALGSESALQVLNDRINFLVGSQVSAYLTAAGFHFDRGILTLSLSVGNFMWVYDQNSGHLRLIIRN